MNHDPRVDRLREQLQALGYLDAGVDRFVLAGARGERSPGGVAARAALRVGLLGGALLGPAAAIGVGARVPGLVSGVRDALVLALYLGVAFCVGLACLSFAISVIIRGLIRSAAAASFAVRARRASAAAGAILAIGCLAYLTFWWRNASAGFGWDAPARTAFALLVAIVISFLLGRAEQVTALAVLATGRPGVPLPRVTSRSWRTQAAVAMLAFAGAAALLVLTASVSVPSAQPPLTVVSRGAHVHVIAIDGVDRRIFDEAPWIDPALTVERYRLTPENTADPARAWTTIATGEPPSVHGVHGLETRRVAGLQGILWAGDGPAARALRATTDLIRLTRPSIASRDERRALTVWEIAEAAGLRSAVVNWWATWPASSRGGLVLSDRAIVRLEQGGALDAEIAPPTLYQTLAQVWPSLRQRAQTTARTAFPDGDDPSIAAVLRRSAELDATVIDMLRALPGPARDLDVVYLAGLDIAQHALLGESIGAAAPSMVAARVAAVRQYYAFLRGLLHPLLQPAPGDVMVLVTQPGRVSTPADGVLLICGVPRGMAFDRQSGVHDEGAVSVLDIVPTVVDVLGIPQSRELSGKSDAGDLGTPLSRRYVQTYGRPFTVSPPREGKPLDREMIDRLRSLGYVK